MSCYRGQAKEGLPKDYMAEESGEEEEADDKDLGWHSSHGKGPTDVERLYYCPTCCLANGVKDYIWWYPTPAQGQE